MVLKLAFQFYLRKSYLSSHLIFSHFLFKKVFLILKDQLSIFHSRILSLTPPYSFREIITHQF